MTANKNLPALEGGTPVREEGLPFHRSPIDEEGIQSVSETLRSGWLTIGPKTEAFENALAGYIGARHAIAISSCSEAMFLALKALGIGPGDEVITSVMTFASTVQAIIHTGATPVLVDIEDETYGLDPAAIEGRITPKTRAVLPVHFGGQACRIDTICDIAKKHGLFVVEDAAHSFGAAYRDQMIGTFGDITAFSFYATKNLTTGEGGCLTLRDDRLDHELRRLSFHGMSRDTWERYTDKESWYYEVEITGYKCNMNDILSSIGLSELKKVDQRRERRSEIAAEYIRGLQELPAIQLSRVRPGNLHSWHLFVIRLDPDQLSLDRDGISKALSAENISCSVHFIPVHKHPFFAPYLRANDQFPVCEDYFARCLSLPIYPGMSSQDISDVVNGLKKIVSHYSKP
jgi:dTDP-4-amino-4,6-dideoxygalactose transaminase